MEAHISLQQPFCQQLTGQSVFVFDPYENLYFTRINNPVAKQAEK